ncbi:hypothetical protein C805_00479 [Eubacterium sp. 14-2]|nr:hypothetical protein C805_00479 [Eubacterium sp. 14-2]
MEKKMKYNIINVVVLLITMLFFIYNCRDLPEIFAEKDLTSVFLLGITVILVHVIKAGRLYLALYGSEIAFITYLNTYCKVTPVSIMLPFKLGELFRMYCYGQLLGNNLKGVVIILFDRFMDTTALMTAILLVWIFHGGQITSFAYMFLVFLIITLLIYFVYPEVYKFWKRYLLRAKASERKMAVLKILEMLNLIYREIENVTKGRGMILYFMSLFAWGIEIGSLMFLDASSRYSDISHVISDYLASAVKGNQSVELKQFVIVSACLLIAVYSASKVGEMLFGKKVYD